MDLRPLPVKVRKSFDVPKLLDLINEHGSFSTDATMVDLMAVRNYISRKALPLTLGQAIIKDTAGERIVGYTLTLRPREYRNA